MKIVVDIDGVICDNTNGEYEKAIPYPHIIEYIKRQIQAIIGGNIILIYRAGLLI